MEGTRHERIALVIVAYIIGFTTAYIAFGVHKLNEDTTFVAEAAPSSPVVTHVQQHQTAVQQGPKISDMNVDASGFFVTINGYKRLLAANVDSISPAEAEVIGKEGSFYKIVGASLSGDGQFAYFCNQAKQTDTNCMPYVYDVDTDMLHAVTVDAQPYTSIVASTTSTWSPAGTLSLDGFKSATATEPWRLASNS